MTTTDWLIRALGILCVVAAVLDIYMTVLFARGGVGLISPRLHSWCWRLLRWFANGSNSLRKSVLPHAGPLLLVLDMLAWSSLLLVGFALIVWPELGTGIQSSSNEPTPQGFSAALYFAGYSLTTLGTGDLVPKTSAMRLLIVCQAGLGFSVLTLSLTYFMSVYSALARRNRFALTLHHQASGGDTVMLMSRMMQGSNDVTQRSFADINANLNDLYESHHLYPIVHYFYLPSPAYAMARVLFLSLDAVTIVRTALDADKSRALVNSAAVEGTWQSGLHMLGNLSQTFLPSAWRNDTATDDEEHHEWKQHFDAAIQALQQAGVETTTDYEDSWKRYRELRTEWNGLTQSFCHYMAHDWENVVEPQSQA